jgi:nucleoside-diphosphate-sugar epimerase
VSCQIEIRDFPPCETSVPSTRRKKIIVSGVSGFTGIKLCQALANQDFEIYAVKRNSNRTVKRIITNLHEIDLEDFNQVREVLDTNEVFAVIHLATNYKRDEQPDARDKIWSANFDLGKKLLEIAIESGAHFLHFESYLQFEEIEPSEYIKSKVAFSALVDQERKRNTVGISSLIFFDNYGESDKRNKILDSLIMAKKNGTKIKLENPKGVVLLTPINDVISATLEVLSKKQFGRFRINGSEKYILHELAEFINDFPSEKILIPIKTLTYSAEHFPLLDSFHQTSSVVDYIKSRLTKESIDAS